MKTLITVLMAAMLASCSKSDNTQHCDTSDPLRDIPWLREIKERFDKDMGPQRQMIIQYQYRGETVFLIDDCHGCADNLITVYDCEKNTVCEFGGIAGKNTCSDFHENATNKKVLYDQ